MPASINFPAIFMARRYYAVWSAPVDFNPQGPGQLAEGGHIPTVNPPGSYFTRSHILGRHIDPHHNQPERPGWPNDAFTGYWFAPVPISPEFPTGRRYYHPSGPRQVMQETELFGAWRVNIQFRPGHGRGRLAGGTANINRTVHEGLALNTNPEAQRVPAATYATAPAWANDPGMTFAGWRRIDEHGEPYNRNLDGTLPAPGTPERLWTTAEVNAMVPIGVSRYYFEAVWGLRLEFHKVGAADQNDPPYPLLFTPLRGARFVLEREVPASGGGTEWVLAYPLEYVTGTGWQPADPPYVESHLDGAVDGLVFIGNTFNPHMELPRTGNTNVFRIREIQAPTGYRTPPTGSYWRILVEPGLGVPPTFTASSTDIPAFLTNQTITDEDCPYEGIRQRLPNIPYEFNFWKVNGLGTRLPSAQFRLFEFNGDDNVTPVIPAPGLVTTDMLGNGPTQWTEIPMPTSSPTEAMTVRLRPGRYYHLVETLPPVGYQHPWGQWRIKVDTATMPNHPTLDITLISQTNIPPILPHQLPGDPPVTVPITYNIFNWPGFDLPLTGGLGGGMLALTIVGSMVLFIGMAFGVVVVVRRRKAVVTSE